MDLFKNLQSTDFGHLHGLKHHEIRRSHVSCLKKWIILFGTFMDLQKLQMRIQAWQNKVQYGTICSVPSIMEKNVS